MTLAVLVMAAKERQCLQAARLFPAMSPQRHGGHRT